MIESGASVNILTKQTKPQPQRQLRVLVTHLQSYQRTYIYILILWVCTEIGYILNCGLVRSTNLLQYFPTFSPAIAAFCMMIVAFMIQKRRSSPFI